MARTAPLDATAIGLSGLCLVHCLALPVLAAGLPMLGAFSEAEWVHWLFVALAAPISAYALSKRLREPVSFALFLLAGVGIAALAAGAAGWPSERHETALTVAGGLVLASAHVWNWRRSALPVGRFAARDAPLGPVVWKSERRGDGGWGRNRTADLRVMNPPL